MKTKKKVVKKAKKSKSKINKKPIIFAIILIAFAVLLITGSIYTFANWTINRQQTDENIVNSGCLSILFNDKDINDNIININLSNSYPMSDSMGLGTIPYSFTVKNTCTLKANINIYLHSISTSTLDSRYIKYNIINDINNTSYTRSLNNHEIAELDSYYLAELQNNILNSYNIDSVTLEPDDTASFNLRLWIDDTAPNEIMGKTFTCAITTTATPVN